MIQSRMKQGNHNPQGTRKSAIWYFLYYYLKFNLVKLGYNDHSYNEHDGPVEFFLTKFDWYLLL